MVGSSLQLIIALRRYQNLRWLDDITRIRSEGDQKKRGEAVDEDERPRFDPARFDPSFVLEIERIFCVCFS